jgi:capsular exopolysaccharide synthesis family protein
MSWFYDALLRAEKDRPGAGKDGGASVSSPGGDSFLTAIESLSSMSTKGTPATTRAVSSAAVLTEEAPVPSPEVPTPAAVPATFVAAEKAQSRNGYRHLDLPVQEESRLVFHTDSHGLAAEQFRLLRRTLSQEFNKGAVVMITSPGVGDGKTLTSLNLCASLADGGDATLLVEVDVRRPTVGKILGPIAPPGIEDVYAGKVEPTQAIHLVEKLSFHAAMVAKVPSNPSHLVNGEGMKQLLAWGRERFRWVVLDAPPVLPAADVADLLPLADVILLVIRAQNTPRELSKRAFEMMGKRLYGVILNEATIDSNPYYRYLDPYYYQGSGAANGH